MNGIRFGLPVRELVVVEGDQLQATVLLDVYIRLSGIAVPVLANPDERAAAEVVFLAIQKWIGRQEYISVNPVGYDQTRHQVLCAVNGSEGTDLASWLLAEHLAHPCDGQPTRPWTAEELDYIEARRGEFEP